MQSLIDWGWGIQALIFFSVNTSHGLRSPLRSPNSGLPGGMKLSRNRLSINGQNLTTENPH